MDEVEGTAREVAEGGRTQPGAQLVQASVIRPLDVRETKAAMDQYQQGLRSLLEDGDWQNTGDGQFVKKSGWRKIATWFGLSVQLVSQRVERDEQGLPLRASVIARAEAPNGRFMEGDGHCSSEERRFKSSSGSQKLENDLIATATTRAKNRAIADLVGMGAVSAEEVEGTAHRPTGPEFGEAASDDLQEKLVKALHVLVGPEKIAMTVERLAQDAGGYLPRISARAVCLALAERLGTEVKEEEQPEKSEQAVYDETPEEGVPEDGDAGSDEGAADDSGAEGDTEAAVGAEGGDEAAGS